MKKRKSLLDVNNYRRYIRLLWNADNPGEKEDKLRLKEFEDLFGHVIDLNTIKRKIIENNHGFYFPSAASDKVNLARKRNFAKFRVYGLMSGTNLNITKMLNLEGLSSVEIDKLNDIKDMLKTVISQESWDEGTKTIGLNVKERK